MLLNADGRKLAFAAVCAALAVGIAFISTVIPSVKISMAAVAGLCCAAALIELGRLYSVLSFVVSAALMWLLLPVKSTAVMFTAFFGWYPILKSLAEQMKSRAVEWAVKFAAFNIAAVALYLLGEAVTGVSVEAPWWGLLIGANLVFFAYDYCMTKLITLYITRISPRLGKKA